MPNGWRTSFRCEPLVGPSGKAGEACAPSLPAEEVGSFCCCWEDQGSCQVTAPPPGGLAREPRFGAKVSCLSSPHCLSHLSLEVKVTQGRGRLHRTENNQICSWKGLQRSFIHLLDTFHNKELTSSCSHCWAASFIRKLF